MPIQAPQWTEFLSCPICYNIFDEGSHRPISLGCGHTVCKSCLTQLPQKKCPFDQTAITRSLDELPVNFALLQLVGVAVPDLQEDLANAQNDLAENHHYSAAIKCIEELAIFLKPLPQASGAVTTSSPTCSSSSSIAPSSPFLSRPMQRKLVSLVNCQLIEEEGRTRAVKAARSLGERTVTEMILLHQNPQQLSANLWAGVRARGCQFLGPAMQEEVLKLILLALEDGSALSRKVLVLFVVQRLETQYPQASKTAIGHVVQLLYRASCFKVTKRDEESSLMQLKDEFRTYEALRREHDSQIVQIATEAGLRISPEQWSSLLYGDTMHKSHMQSIIDKLQTPQSFGQSINELTLALQRTGDPGNLSGLRVYFELLANVDQNTDNPSESWTNVEYIMQAILFVVKGLIDFTSLRSRKGIPPDMAVVNPVPGPMPNNAKYKTSMCRDLTLRGQCPRGTSCTFAHSHEEMEKFRARSKKLQPALPPSPLGGSKRVPTSGALTPKEKQELAYVTQVTMAKLAARQTTVSQAQMRSDTCSTSSETPSSIMSLNPNLKLCIVPTAKPSVLSASTKQFIMKRDSIYSSPTHIDPHGNVPNIMPITHKAPSIHNGPGECRGAGGPRMYMQQQSSHHRGMDSRNGGPPRLPSGPPPPYEPPPDYQRVQHSNDGATTDENQLAMPPNPYTARCHFVSSHPSNTPAKHLGDLQKRRDELLDRLNLTSGHSQPISIPSTESTMSYTSAGAALSSALTIMTNSTNMSAMTTHVADSMASTHSIMSLEQAQNNPDWDPERDLNQGDEACSSRVLSLSPSTKSDDSTSSDYQLFGDMGNGNWSTGYSSSQEDTEREEYVRSPQKLQGDQGDEFVPFEHTTVSKYGPISRRGCTGIKDKFRYSVPPVNVIAGQPRDTIPVAAIHPNMRRYPISSPIASSTYSGYTYLPTSVAQGVSVASSLPTAMMKPSVIAAGTNSIQGGGLPTGQQEPRTLWALKEKMLSNMSDNCTHSNDKQTKIHQELCCVSQEIQNLQLSEEARMSRELQSIEMNIRETRKQVSDTEQQDFLLAREEQNYEVAKEQEKKVQEALDRHLAQKLALEEANDVIIRSTST